MIKCNVIADVSDMRGKSVLVFLQPVRPTRNILIHAWQVLDLSGQATASFDFAPLITARVTTPNRSSGTLIQSESRAINPGELLQVIRPGGLSLQFEPCPYGMTKTRLTPAQSGIYNQTNPPTSIDCQWMVNGNPVATVPDVDWDMTCTFEYEPALYFLIAAPLLTGNNYTAQAFTGAVPYIPSPDTSVLDVRVRRQRDRWMFDFQPDWA